MTSAPELSEVVAHLNMFSEWLEQGEGFHFLLNS